MDVVGNSHLEVRLLQPIKAESCKLKATLPERSTQNDESGFKTVVYLEPLETEAKSLLEGLKLWITAATWKHSPWPLAQVVRALAL
jgi:hypothetical protein